MGNCTSNKKKDTTKDDQGAERCDEVHIVKGEHSPMGLDLVKRNGAVVIKGVCKGSHAEKNGLGSYEGWEICNAKDCEDLKTMSEGHDNVVLKLRPERRNREALDMKPPEGVWIVIPSRPMLSGWYIPDPLAASTPSTTCKTWGTEDGTQTVQYKDNQWVASSTETVGTVYKLVSKTSPDTITASVWEQEVHIGVTTEVSPHVRVCSWHDPMTDDNDFTQLREYLNREMHINRDCFAIHVSYLTSDICQNTDNIDLCVLLVSLTGISVDHDKYAMLVRCLKRYPNVLSAWKYCGLQPYEKCRKLQEHTLRSYKAEHVLRLNLLSEYFQLFLELRKPKQARQTRQDRVLIALLEDRFEDRVRRKHWSMWRRWATFRRQIPRDKVPMFVHKTEPQGAPQREELQKEMVSYGTSMTPRLEAVRTHVDPLPVIKRSPVGAEIKKPVADCSASEGDSPVCRRAPNLYDASDTEEEAPVAPVLTTERIWPLCTSALPFAKYTSLHLSIVKDRLGFVPPMVPSSQLTLLLSEGVYGEDAVSDCLQRIQVRLQTRLESERSPYAWSYIQPVQADATQKWMLEPILEHTLNTVHPNMTRYLFIKTEMTSPYCTGYGRADFVLKSETGTPLLPVLFCTEDISSTLPQLWAQVATAHQHQKTLPSAHCDKVTYGIATTGARWLFVSVDNSREQITKEYSWFVDAADIVRALLCLFTYEWRQQHRSAKAAYDISK